MGKTELEYSFHDSVIISCSQQSEDHWLLKLQLYAIPYPQKDIVQLSFSGIYNAQAVTKLIQSVIEDQLEPEWNGTRINVLQFDTKKASQTSNLYFFLDVDGFSPLRIHCRNFSIEKLPEAKS